jgi:signal transduction histidine kinase
MDNALRHNMPGGRLDVSTRTQNSRAVLSVANTGPAVPATAEDRLFQPFQRLGTDRGGRGDGLGLGLGLPIVQPITDARHASITAQPRPEGGLLIEVAFPEPSNVISFFANPRPSQAARRCPVSTARARRGQMRTAVTTWPCRNQ